MTNSDIKYAGFWRRAVASTIDTVIFIVPSMALIYICLKILSLLSGEDYSLHAYSQGNIPLYVSIITQILAGLFWLFIYSIFLSSKWQATPGKRIMHAYVASKDNIRLSFKKAAFRAVLPWLLVLPTVFLMPSDTQVNEANEKYIAVLSEDMPKTTSELAIVFPDAGKATKKDIISKIAGDPNLRTIYSQEFESLDDIKKQEVRDASGDVGNLYSNNLELFGIWYFVLMAWYLMAAFTPQKTAMHDIIAKTRVIKGKI